MAILYFTKGTAMGRDRADRPVQEADEIEITPEMIEAGCRELSLFEANDPPWSIVREIYLAMELARTKADR